MGMCIPLIESVIWANLNESVFTPYCDRVWQRAISSSAAAQRKHQQAKNTSSSSTYIM